jgi:hypothetical protein
MTGQMNNNNWEIQQKDVIKRIMNPNLYHRVQGILSLNHFAELVQAPPNWEDI